MTEKKKVKALYTHPFPDFVLDPQKWLGVSFGAGKLRDSDYSVPLVGFVFSEEQYAKQIYNLILRWTEGEHKDEEKCIRVAVIEDTPSSYVFFCHPNPSLTVPGANFSK